MWSTECVKRGLSLKSEENVLDLDGLRSKIITDKTIIIVKEINIQIRLNLDHELIECRRTSSGYRNTLECGEKGRPRKPLIYTRKRRGHNMDPWGTPEIA